MVRFGRAAAKRWTILGATLVLTAGLSAFAADAVALAGKPKVPLPKPRPIARSAAPKTAVAARPPIQLTSPDAVPPAAAFQPATRQHAALPPAAARKPVPAPVLAATSSTSQADTDAVQKVIELVRAHKPADATQLQATISDPVGRKLA